MHEVLETEDIGELASAKAVLDAAGIKYFVFEENIGAQFSYAAPWRIMVPEAAYDDALDALEDAGFFDEAVYS